MTISIQRVVPVTVVPSMIRNGTGYTLVSQGGGLIADAADGMQSSATAAPDAASAERSGFPGLPTVAPRLLCGPAFRHRPAYRGV